MKLRYLNVRASMAALTIIVIILLGSACDQFNPKMDWLVIHGQTMGTRYTIKAHYAPHQVTRGVLQEEISSALLEVNNKLSNWYENSEVSDFNASRSRHWHEISNELFAVVSEAMRLHQESQGRFDITLSPLINLWGFGPENNNKSPSEAQIKAALQLVGQSSLLFVKNNPPSIRKNKGEVTINLSAIAKGYGVDMIATRFEKLGVKDYIIEIGGDLRASGNNQDGVPWQVGIERPDGSGQSLQHIISLQNMSIATSGDYRKFIDKDGKRFSHIIDPVTGRPTIHNLASVSVLANNAMRADGLATTFMVLGKDHGLALAEKLKVAAFFITRSGKHFQSTQSSLFKAIENK